MSYRLVFLPLRCERCVFYCTWHTDLAHDTCGHDQLASRYYKALVKVVLTPVYFEELHMDVVSHRNLHIYAIHRDLRFDVGFQCWHCGLLKQESYCDLDTYSTLLR